AAVLAALPAHDTSTTDTTSRRRRVCWLDRSSRIIRCGRLGLSATARSGQLPTVAESHGLFPARIGQSCDANGGQGNFSLEQTLFRRRRQKKTAASLIVARARPASTLNGVSTG